MFGSNKLIKTTILNASENYLNEYAQDIIELYNEYGEDLNEEQFYKVRNEYLDNVANNAFDVFRVSSPMIYQRILLMKKKTLRKSINQSLIFQTSCCKC